MTIGDPWVFSHHVVIPTNLVSDRGTVLVLYRHELGHSGPWRVSTPLRSTQSIPVTFITAQRGWAVVHGSPGLWTVMQTVNGGTTWRSIKTLSIPFNLSNIQFATTHDGWLWGVSNSANHSDYFLWRTTDGGYQWHAITPSLAVLHGTH
jgi:photosystem II stability/assembly factor-like uncharacterized protein